MQPSGLNRPFPRKEKSGSCIQICSVTLKDCHKKLENLSKESSTRNYVRNKINKVLKISITLFTDFALSYNTVNNFKRDD